MSSKRNSKKFVYFFGNKKADGRGSMKEVLGGKGAGLAEMTEIGINVPPGFTISTKACGMFYQNKRKTPKQIIDEMKQNLSRLEKITGKNFGNTSNPLLVSVRSGAMFSMPGMMDTILNLGLNDRTVIALSKKTKNPRFAWDAYRRFIQMFADVVLKIDKNLFEEMLEALKKKENAKHDIDLNDVALKGLVQNYKKLVKSKTGSQFPQNPTDQLVKAINAVFLSWNNNRTIFYRKKYNIPSDIGTGVTVQSMVFGNMGTRCGTGVGFTRDPLSGEKELFAEYLLNAQGEKDLAKQVENGKIIKRFLRENADQDNPNIFMLKNFIKHIGSNTDLIKELKLKTEIEETEDFSVKDILTGKADSILNSSTKSEDQEQMIREMSDSLNISEDEIHSNISDLSAATQIFPDWLFEHMFD